MLLLTPALSSATKTVMTITASTGLLYLVSFATFLITGIWPVVSPMSLF